MWAGIIKEKYLRGTPYITGKSPRRVRCAKERNTGRDARVLRRNNSRTSPIYITPTCPITKTRVYTVNEELITATVSIRSDWRSPLIGLRSAVSHPRKITVSNGGRRLRPPQLLAPVDLFAHRGLFIVSGTYSTGCVTTRTYYREVCRVQVYVCLYCVKYAKWRADCCGSSWGRWWRKRKSAGMSGMITTRTQLKKKYLHTIPENSVLRTLVLNNNSLGIYSYRFYTLKRLQHLSETTKRTRQLNFWTLQMYFSGSTKVFEVLV